MGTAALITQMDIPAETESEFNNWYTNEHVAERVDLPGFKSAFRFKALDASPKYFAYYETDNLDALTTPTYKACRPKRLVKACNGKISEFQPVLWTTHYASRPRARR